jgi:hypothetical protein
MSAPRDAVPSACGCRSLKTLLQEIPRYRTGSAFQLTENLEAELLVKGPRLEFEGIEPKTDVTAPACDLLGLSDQPLPKALAAQAFGYREITDERPSGAPASGLRAV